MVNFLSGITKFSLKVADENEADSNKDVAFKLCDSSGKCCNTGPLRTLNNLDAFFLVDSIKYETISYKWLTTFIQRNTLYEFNEFVDCGLGWTSLTEIETAYAEMVTDTDNLMIEFVEATMKNGDVYRCTSGDLPVIINLSIYYRALGALMCHIRPMSSFTLVRAWWLSHALLHNLLL